MEGIMSPPCLLLDRLPPEIRLEIFKYLLAARSNMYETTMKSVEYASRRESLLRGPDHSIRFHTPILRVNHQINNEAYKVFIQENIFVLITHDTLEACWYSMIKLKECGAVVLAEADQARKFPNIGMSFDVKGGDESAVCDQDKSGRRHVSVITVEDLPAACVALQQKIIEHDKHSRDITISITIDPQIEKVSIRSKDGSPATSSKLHRCLEPLRELRWVRHVEISGCGYGSYLADIIATMCGDPLSAAEAMNLVAEYISRGDTALIEGADRVAIARFKDAIKVIQSSFFHELEMDQILDNGMFKGVTAAWARDEVEIRLHVHIASILLRKGSYILARVYVERIYGPLHSMDDRGWDTKFPLEINQGNEEAYAELLMVAAQISLTHGQANQAYDELHEASCLDPENEEVKLLLEKCRRLKEYRDKSPKWIEQSRRNEQQHEAGIEIARARNAKGDEAFKNKKYMAALTKYEAAYAQLRKLECHWRNNWSWNATCLAVEVLPKLLTVCLEIQDYEGGQYWADIILNFVPGYIYEQHKIDAYMRTARFTAYYSNALALQKQEKIRGAIRNYEKALSLDGNVYTVVKQLKALKQLEESRILERESAEELLRQKRTPVRSREKKKARHKLARRIKQQKKRMRGSGFIVGVGAL